MEAESTNVWDDDLLERKFEADFLLRFLKNKSLERTASNKGGSYVLNLDGGWGEGKTFFLTHFQKQIEKEDFVSVYVNAWKDDFADDPMIAVMSAIDKSLNEHLQLRGKVRTNWQKAKKAGLKIAIKLGASAARTAADRYIGQGFNEAAALWAAESSNQIAVSEEDLNKIGETATKAFEKLIDKKTEEALKHFDENKKSIEDFKKNLEVFLETLETDTGKKLPLFILVDELDRCRPTYAITTLERIKHFFEIKNVVFIVATDSQQLKHSIKAVYGQDFDSSKYLLRFFDRTYKFMEPQLTQYISYLLATNSISSGKYSLPFISLADLLEKFAIGLKLRLRDLDQIYDHLRNVLTTWDEKVPMQMAYLLPLIVSYQQDSSEIFETLAKLQFTTEVSQYFSPVGLVYQKDIRGYNTRTETQRASFTDMLSETISFGNMTLVNISRADHATQFKREIAGIFNNEFAILHSNRVYHGSTDPMSVLSGYGAYVRSAGRIAKIAEQEQ